MDSFVLYFYEVIDSLDISCFLSSSEINSTHGIISFINYSDLTAIFLLGLFTSLYAFTFCCTSKKPIHKYIVVQQEPINDKIINV